MSPDSIELVKTQLDRLKTGHTGKLLSVGSAAIEQFDPLRRATFSHALSVYQQNTLTELRSYASAITELLLARTRDLLLPVTEESKSQLVHIASLAFDEQLYPKRLKLQRESMLRKAARVGLEADAWSKHMDAELALHQAGTANLIRGTLASLSDELELLRLHSSRQIFTSLKSLGATLMPFAELMTDKIDVLKADGTKVTGRMASVQRDQVFMAAADVLVEPNDLIVRRMSNGAEETYRVVDPGFHEAFHEIKAHYQMEVVKLGLPEAKAAVQNISYHITGNNPRINNHSIDNSTNIIQIDARASQYIEELRNELRDAHLQPADKQAALEIVDEVEASLQSGKPKKSVMSALLNSLPHVANVASVVAKLLDLV